MHYERQLNGIDPFSSIIGGVISPIVGGVFNYLGTKEAIKGQQKSGEQALQAQYQQARAQQELLQQQVAASAAQENFGVQKESREIQTIALMGVAGVAVLIAGVFIWRATKK